MKAEFKTINFDFDYTGSNYTEKEAIENGFPHLSGKELLSRICNKTIFGDYPDRYKYVSNIYEDGTAEGVNNVGTFDIGNWRIDFENDTLLLEWKNYWIDTITRAYLIDGNIEFYDIDTGNWRTTFKTIKNLK